MSRALRIVGPDLMHHVMNRGASRRPIFLTLEDRLSFLALLELICMRWSVEVLAFCLMDTHYHLLLRDVHGNLSKAMRLQ